MLLDLLTNASKSEAKEETEGKPRQDELRGISLLAFDAGQRRGWRKIERFIEGGNREYEEWCGFTTIQADVYHQLVVHTR